MMVDGRRINMNALVVKSNKRHTILAVIPFALEIENYSSDEQLSR